MPTGVRLDRSLYHFTSTSIEPCVLIQLSVVQSEFDVRALHQLVS